MGQTPRLESFRLFIGRTSTTHLIAGIGAVGFLAAPLTLLVGFLISGDGLQARWVLTSSISPPAIWGLAGIVIMIKKEFPRGLYKIRGLPAVIIGILWTLFFWGFAASTLFLFGMLMI